MKRKKRERRSHSHFSFSFLFFFVRYSKGTNISDVTKFDFGCSSLRRVSRNYFIRGHNPGRSWTCVQKSPLPTMGQVVLKMSFRGLQVGRVGYMRAAQSTLTVILKLITWWPDQCHLEYFIFIFTFRVSLFLFP